MSIYFKGLMQIVKRFQEITPPLLSLFNNILIGPYK